MDYPAWRVELDGSHVPADVASEGQLLIPIPAGTHRIVVRFARTWDRTSGGLISLVFLLALLGFMFATKRGWIASKEASRC
jgi:hypothetical protein